MYADGNALEVLTSSVMKIFKSDALDLPYGVVRNSNMEGTERLATGNFATRKKPSKRIQQR